MQPCVIPAAWLYTVHVMVGAEQPSWQLPGLHQRLVTRPACSPQTATEASRHPALLPYKYQP